MHLDRWGAAAMPALMLLIACTSETPATDDHVLKGHVQSMEKARQVEGVVQERVDALQQQMNEQQQ